MLALLAASALTADVWPSIAGSVAPHEQNLPLVEMQRAPTARPATSLLNSRRPPLNLRGGAARVTMATSLPVQGESRNRLLEWSAEKSERTLQQRTS